MTLREHARMELEAAGLFSKDSDYEGMLGDAVMELIEKFADQGHSGFSASMCISIFTRLARYEPLSPLTGADDEWTELNYDGDVSYQNKRCGRVFKDADGRAYDIEGKVFREPNGATYTSKESRVFVAFPYTPTTEIVDVPASEGDA